MTQVAGQLATKAGEATVQAASAAGNAFHELLASSDDAADSVDMSTETTAQLREQIADAAERVMQSIGLSLEQPLELTAADDGTLQVDANHPRKAEVEMSLNADPQLPGLVNKLLAKADSAARHFVLHRVAAAP